MISLYFFLSLANLANPNVPNVPTSFFTVVAFPLSRETEHYDANVCSLFFLAHGHKCYGELCVKNLRTLSTGSLAAVSAREKKLWAAYVSGVKIVAEPFFATKNVRGLFLQV